MRVRQKLRWMLRVAVLLPGLMLLSGLFLSLAMHSKTEMLVAEDHLLLQKDKSVDSLALKNVNFRAQGVSEVQSKLSEDEIAAGRSSMLYAFWSGSVGIWLFGIWFLAMGLSWVLLYWVELKVKEGIQSSLNFASELADGRYPRASMLNSSDLFYELQCCLNRISDSFRKGIFGVKEQSKSMVSASVEFISISTAMSHELMHVAMNAERSTILVRKLNEFCEKMTLSLDNSLVATQEVAISTDDMQLKTSQIIDTIRALNSHVSVTNDSMTRLLETVDVVKKHAESTEKQHRLTFKTAQSAKSRMQNLGASTAEIESMVSVVQSIAGKTRLLALNAAIEAASAGNAGSGFAVVAGEVKNLAMQTSDALHSIEDIVERMRANTDGAVNSIKSIVSSLEEVEKETVEVSAAIQNQQSHCSTVFSSMHELSCAMADIEQVSGKMSDNAGQLNEYANALNVSMEDLTGDVLMTSSSADEIAQRVIEVGKNTFEVSAMTHEILHEGSNLTLLAKKLDAMVVDVEDII